MLPPVTRLVGVSASPARGSEAAIAPTHPGDVRPRPSTERVAPIGPFVLHLDRQQLLRDGEPVRIGSRALALLIALVEKGGDLVGKDELISRAWPDTFVEEANLRVHIAALRKVLGDTGDPPQYIANVSGRGYRFVAAPPPELKPSVEARSGSPAASLTRLIGRDEEVATLTERVTRRRLITVSGPGGIGKTSVALAVAQQLGPVFDDRIEIVDLGAAATDAKSMPQAIGIALKVSLAGGDPLGSLGAFLKDKSLLLLLDNCEHIIDAVTETAEFLLRQAPRLHILATSTEPMRAEGEWIFRLLPLAVPSEAENLTAEEALGIPAIELFVERAAAGSEAFQFTDQDVPLVSEICRRLDGNPLAIEIAAASVEAFGLRDLTAHLDDRFDLLVRGRRTAAPRHQTLRNLLDWSHGTLSPSEQTTLRRLAVFRGAFTLEAARAVAAIDGRGLSVVSDIASLVRKSLLTADVGGAQATYRLLDSTRAYARQKAVEAEELGAVSRLHARYFEGLLRRAEADWPRLDRTAWIDAYGYMIDDARAATDWALGDSGDVGQGIRLTALLLPLEFQFGLVEEMSARIETALARAHEADPREIVAEIRLNVSRASLGQTRDVEAIEDDPHLRRALSLAGKTGDPVFQVSALIKIAVQYLNTGHYRRGLRFADEANTALAASPDDLARLGVERVLAQAADMAGEHRRAREVASRVIRHPARNIPLAFGSMQVDRQVSMRVVTARSLWIEGFAGEAKALALEALGLARKDGPYAICLALGFGACPIALWSGLDEEAKGLTRELLEKAERYTLGAWHLWGELFDMVLARRRGDAPTPVVPSQGLQADTLVTIDPAGVDANALVRASADLAGWANPELLRAAAIRADILALETERGPQTMRLLEQSLAQARARGALAWELRTGTTIAELQLVAGNPAAARATLEPIYERLPEGFGTADALTARDMLERRLN